MADLIERLRAVEGGDDGTHWYRNPDGPEAAARIAELEAEVARLKAERDVARHAIGEDDALDAFGYLAEPKEPPMSTDREREALARLLYDRREGPVANQDFARQSRLWDECLFHADTVIAAGWMPRPKPGSAEWEAMVGKGARAIWDQPGSGCSWERLTHAVRGQCIADAAACLRAALNTGAPDAE
ncbi:hypothetical protein [Thauera sp.]|uniref:hypothetical protein n=1 Tax=Thauera sp. TaxID=1905334 RepID=UPI002BD418B0|nr:hypothetical protein [Thauera sp.]HRP26374.1 hypothetical protein [Thauera sp.]